MGDELDDMTESMSGAMSLDGDSNKLAAFYADWASYYDEDVATHGYGMPGMVVEALERAIEVLGADSLDRSRARVVDAGCGTGLVGQALHDHGWHNLHGVDLSPEMVEEARERGIYDTLTGGVDLTVPVSAELAGSADVVTVGGLFTVGHVPPEALAVMAGIARPGGLLVLSTRQAYHQDTDFVAVSEQLVYDGVLELLVRIAEAPYTMDSTGDYWAYQVNPGASER
ncbi:MAG: class I SAM-dependent DNA methyltransferase [Acidimicrobiales bacterium]